MEAIDAGLAEIVAFITRYAITLAALGVLTVALIEAYKKLFSTLPKFHQSALQRWLEQQEARPPMSDAVLQPDLKKGGHYGVAGDTRATAIDDKRGPPYEWRRAYDELLHLSTGLKLGSFLGESAAKDGGNIGFSRNVSFALFELELSRMMAQVQEAADACLNSPRRYAHWFQFVTRGCDAKDVQRWIESFGGDAPPTDDQRLTQAEREQMAELYGRIRLLVRRQLDSFQTITAYRWREWNQFWSWAVGGALLMVVQVFQFGGPTSVVDFVKMFAIALLGGILAPVAKDLMDALASFKARG